MSERPEEDGRGVRPEGSGARELLSLCIGAWRGLPAQELPEPHLFGSSRRPHSLGTTYEITRPPIGD